MLPAFLQQKYSEARAAYDQKEYAAAAEAFGRVINGLADPDIASMAGQSPLSDLGTLAAGFRDLATKAMMPPVAPKAAVVLAAPVASTSAPKTYSPADSDVTPPVIIRQAIPPYTKPVVQRKTAVVELVVNEHGTVDSAAMASSLDPTYRPRGRRGSEELDLRAGESGGQAGQVSEAGPDYARARGEEIGHEGINSELPTPSFQLM